MRDWGRQTEGEIEDRERQEVGNRGGDTWRERGGGVSILNKNTLS